MSEIIRMVKNIRFKIKLRLTCDKFKNIRNMQLKVARETLSSGNNSKSGQTIAKTPGKFSISKTSF